jgi:hypothetical protein
MMLITQVPPPGRDRDGKNPHAESGSQVDAGLEPGERNIFDDENNVRLL